MKDAPVRLLLFGGFGDPVPAGGGSVTSAAPAPGDDPMDLIDENDPRLVADAVDVNVEGDAYAMPAPPPDGKYRAKLKLMQVEDAQQKKHDYLPKLGKKPPKLPYYFTAIEAVLIDPSGKYDGIKLFDRWVGTFVGRDGSTKVQTILSKLTKADGTPWIAKGARMSHKEWIELFVKAMGTEPEIGVETVWEWSCEGCGKEAKEQGKDYPKSIMGMNKFPVDAAKSRAAGITVHSPTMDCKVNQAHGSSTARASIRSFMAAGEVTRA